MATNTSVRSEQGAYMGLTALVLALGIQNTTSDGTYATSSNVVSYDFPEATEYLQGVREDVDLVPAITYENAVNLSAKLRSIMPDYIEDVDLGPDF